MGSSLYDPKLQLMVSLQFWISWKSGVSHNCFYSQVHSDPESYSLLDSLKCIEYICKKMVSTGLEYFKAFDCIQIIYVKS